MKWWQTLTISLCLSFSLNTTNAATLKLEQILQSTENNFPAILIAHQEIDVAKARFLSALGAFDPVLKSGLDTTPKGGYENIYDETSLTLPFTNSGLRLQAKYRIGRGDWPSYYRNFLTNSGGEADFGLVLPIFRNASIDPERAELQKRQVSVIVESFKASVTRVNIMHDAGFAYWAWVAQVKRLRLVKELLKLAKIRQKALVRRKKLGDVPDIELVENKRFILQRKQGLIKAEFELKQAAYLLSLYYRDKCGRPIIPSSKLAPRRLPALSSTLTRSQWHEKRQMIILRNPAVKVLEGLRKVKSIEFKLAKNDMMPFLNAEINGKKQYGQGGDPRLLETAIDGGVRFVLPLPQRQARGQLQAVRNQLLQIDTKNTLLQQKLNVDFNNTLNELGADREQVQILREEVTLAEKVERAEGIRFNQGDSTLFLVNQREQTTFGLRLQELTLSIEFFLSKLRLDALCAFSDYCRYHRFK